MSAAPGRNAARNLWWWIRTARRTAAVADLHLAPRPGTDGALACAVMHVAFRDGHADRGYMARYADCPDALEAHLATRGPEWAAAITGLSVQEIEASPGSIGHAAQLHPARLGFARSRNGAANMHAVSCLPTVTGAWQHEGGGALWSNRGMYHWDKTLIEGLDARRSHDPRAGHEPHRQRADRRPDRTPRRSAGAWRCSSRTKTR